MIYGDRYRMRRPEALLGDVESLHSRHGVTHFALNDEAIPPKLFEKLPELFPKRKFFFTGLYKFEKYFKPEHYAGMYDIGFRSLYIGLESANERVQRQMKKNNTQAVMRANLRDAHAAGIWNHTFNFFGFPSETREEALETAQFLIDHADIIHSEGTGTFSFEHNAPIAKDPANFGVANVVEKTDNVLELYYDYDVVTGLTQGQASELVETFTEMKRQAKAYQYSGWIPREHLLVLLARFRRDDLRRALEQLEAQGQSGARWSQNVSWFALEERDATRFYVVNTQAGTILETNGDAVLLLEFMPKDGRGNRHELPGTPGRPGSLIVGHDHPKGSGTAWPETGPASQPLRWRKTPIIQGIGGSSACAVPRCFHFNAKKSVRAAVRPVR
jgi:anaerobic magnesium-protoporphyrin IX monomethyl ester cyclase